MSTNARELLGGNTLYTVNLTRLNRAVELAYEDPVTAPRIQASLSHLEDELDKLERAAVALVMIDRLLRDL